MKVGAGDLWALAHLHAAPPAGLAGLGEVVLPEPQAQGLGLRGQLGLKERLDGLGVMADPPQHPDDVAWRPTLKP